MLLIGVVLFFSCQRDEGTRVPQAPTENEPGAVSDIVNLGYALRVDTSLMRIDGEDRGDETTRVRWADSMSLGERVSIGETRRLTHATNNNVYEFIAVRRDNGSEGFAWATQVVPAGNLAVVVDERVNLFRSPRTIDVSGVILSRRTVVVYYPETETDGFVRIRGFDFGRRLNIDLNNNHVRLTSLSTRNSDIQSSILLQTAQSLPPAQVVRREALLDAALQYYQDSVFFTEIFTIVNPRPPSML